MTKLQKSKKGFTLTELAIVIAVIAILIAVLVPTFVSLINKANESNDKQLVKNLNTALSTEEITDGKATTMSEALVIAADNGYNVDKLTPSSSGDIVWDQESNRFLLIDEDGNIVYKDDTTSSDVLDTKYQLWYIATSAAKVAEKEYSYYLDYETTAVTAAYGVDVGDNEGVNVTISNSSKSAAASNGVALAAKKLTASTASATPAIRVNTNGGTLKIESTTIENVEHYGTATTVEVAAENSTYTTYATISTSITISADDVTVSAEENSSTIAIVVESSVTGVTVTVATTATVTTVFASDTSASVSGATTSTEDFSSYYAIVGSSYYETLTAAVNAASNGDTVTLLKDYTSSTSDSLYYICKSLSNSLTIDLNGYTITFSHSTNDTIEALSDKAADYYLNLIGGNTDLTLKNGSFVSTKPTSVTSIFAISNGASITLDNMDVNAAGSILYPRGDASTVNVYNSTLYTTGVYCVSTNSATVDNYNVKINLENSTFTTNALDGDSCPVMINVAGILNIDNCEINGQRQGVIVRAGTATITDTAISCSMTYSQVSKGTNSTEKMTQRTSYTESPWASGNGVAMGAVVVGNSYKDSAYKANAVITMTNCSLSYEITNDTTNAYSEYEIALYLIEQCKSSDTYETSVKVSNCTMDGKVINYLGSDNRIGELTGYTGTVYTTWNSTNSKWTTG